MCEGSIRVNKEYTYIIDRDACLVWLPELEEFDDKLHDMITDHQKHLKLSDIAGLHIEHAPRVLAELFWTVLDEDGSVYAVATGELCQSFPPWSAPGVVVEQFDNSLINCDYPVKPII